MERSSAASSSAGEHATSVMHDMIDALRVADGVKDEPREPSEPAAPAATTTTNTFSFKPKERPRRTRTGTMASAAAWPESPYDDPDQPEYLWMIEAQEVDSGTESALFGTHTCHFCNETYELDEDDTISCDECHQRVCAECTGPIFADECRPCQFKKFLADIDLYRGTNYVAMGEYLTLAQGTHRARIAGGAHVPVPGGINFSATNVPNAPPASLFGERGNTPPAQDMGVTGTDVAARLLEVQMRAFGNQAALPLLPSAQPWTPPYSYVQPTTQDPAAAPPFAPAIFAHPRYNSLFTMEQPPMDPAVFPEVHSQASGVPLVQPMRNLQNTLVQEQADLTQLQTPFRTGSLNMPQVAYMPATIQREGEDLPVAVHVDDRNTATHNPSMLRDLEQIHIAQTRSMTTLHERGRKGNSKGRGKGKTDPENVHRYSGLDTDCSICQHPLRRDEFVSRIACNHLFHEMCIADYLATADAENNGCPNCRGPNQVRATFRYLGNQRVSRRRSGRPDFLPPEEDSGSGRSFESSHESARTFMLVTGSSPKLFAEWSSSWTTLSFQQYVEERQGGYEYPGEVPPLVDSESSTDERGNTHSGDAGERGNTPPECETYNLEWVGQVSRTQLPEGKMAMLVDLGSRINVVGRNIHNKLAAKAAAFNMGVQYFKRGKRLLVSGVGEGNAHCDQEAVTPVAVKTAEGRVNKETYRANIADGIGADLPIIWGSDSMQEKDVVLVLRKGKEFVAIPGPAGYKIDWSPGSQLIPMIHAPSNHLVIPCDHFGDIVSGATDENATAYLVTDHTNVIGVEQPIGERGNTHPE